MEKKENAVSKKVKLSSEFQRVFGLSEGTRGQAVKAVWDYAKRNNLKQNQMVPTKKDPAKTRNVAVIMPDAELIRLFGQADFYGVGEVAKGVSANVIQA